MANASSHESLERIEEAQRQLRDSIATSKRLMGEAQALVDHARKDIPQELLVQEPLLRSS